MKNIRYVHKQFGLGKLAGITVAYYRTDTELVFAWAKCIRPDNYSKETGRILSTRNLETMVHPTALLDCTWFDSDKRTGTILIKDLLSFAPESYGELTNIISDQASSALKMTDFKHSFLSNTMVDAILFNTVD